MTRTSADRVLKVVASMVLHDEELFVKDLVANQLVLVKINYFWQEPFPYLLVENFVIDLHVL